MEIAQLRAKIPAFESMQNYPKAIYYKGDLSLLDRPKVAIVGSRKPNQYARTYTHLLASKLADAGVVVVSGGAIGTDAIAHKAAGASNTIMVAATGLDKRYPAINKNIIMAIEKDGLVLSQFEAGTPSQRYNFPIRNELIVALGAVLVVMYADENSGTMRSVAYAQKMKRSIYVLPHRIGESCATNNLVAKGEAEAIYDIDAFVARFGGEKEQKSDAFISYCQSNPTYEEALKKFSSRLFEAELNGTIVVRNGHVYIV